MRSSRKSRPRIARRALGSRNGPRRGAVRAGNSSSPARAAEKQQSYVRYLAAVKNFEIAARAFQRQNYERAKAIFEKLAHGEIREVAERARVHLRLCEQKLTRPGPPPKTAEDHYTLGVGALNVRSLDEAIEHLGRAHKLEPEREHIRYALAAAHALQGNAEAALEHLKAAISLRPANRIQVRHDEDFLALALDSRFRQLVYPEGA